MIGSPLSLLLFLTLLSLTSADDGATILSLSKSLTPLPSGWSTTSSNGYCDWPGIHCDSSSRVTSIDLRDQSLSGVLPPTLSSLSFLKTLSFQANSLSGDIPSFAKLSSLQDLYLDNNNFTGVTDGAFAGLTSLQTLSLSKNPQLSPWVFPSSLSDSGSLTTLYLDNTNILGSLPDIFDKFASLQNLRLSYNNLSGPLPPSFAKSSIQYLWINNQQFGLSDRIDVLSGMTQLNQAWLHKNQFTGPIPDLSNCLSLFDLQLRDNQLTGVVPPSLSSLSGLLNISLDNNKLQGPTPTFPSSVKIQTLDNNNFCTEKAGQECDPQVTILLEVASAMFYPLMLSDSWKGNDPCGNWPFVNCDSTGKIFTLNLGKHGLAGTISPAIANLTSLKNLYLNSNNLTGSIPRSLTQMSNLRVVDLSDNNLTGDIPQFPSNVKFTYQPGNSLLGAAGKSGGNTSPGSGSGSGSEDKTSSRGKSRSLVVGIIVGVIIFLGICGFVAYKFIYKRRYGGVKKPKPEKLVVNNAVIGGRRSNGYVGITNDLNSPSSGNTSDHHFFEAGRVNITMQILHQVTNNFSEANILGRGGFGVVYKGELEDGTKIAVKRMESGTVSSQGMNEFRAEIAVLTKVRHRHLVTLMGYCVNGNERLLVYEYMPQGTLSQHLFEYHELGYPPLTWKQRVSILLDVARGIEYLHSLARESFIHRDLKPSNILLGDDMRAKVADFGLVRNAPEGKYSVETRLAGTFGYLAPEYAVTGRVTTKVDVYSFGVILMENITGKRALEEGLPDERAHLVTWFRRILTNKDNISKAIDEKLNPDEETLRSIYRVAELAGHCTAREPHQRPDMSHAVAVLGPLVEQWIPSSSQDHETSYGFGLNRNLAETLDRWKNGESTSSTMFYGGDSQTHSSIASKPAGFADSFASSSYCR